MHLDFSWGKLHYLHLQFGPEVSLNNLNLRNPLDTIRPELESALRYVVWSSTLLKHQSSVGQTLLGIKFSSESSWRLRVLTALDVFSHYCQHRADFLLRIFPGSEERKYAVSRQMRIVAGRNHSLSGRINWTERKISAGCLKLLNSLWFLRQGLYPSLALLLLNLKPVSTVTESRSIGYSYMSRYIAQSKRWYKTWAIKQYLLLLLFTGLFRELLWSAYRELLMFLVRKEL